MISLYDYLKSNHVLIQFFGLGFIQVKVDDITRYHFYNISVLPTVGFEEVHNHRYPFVSEVLHGEIIQYFYVPVRGDKYYLKQSNCKEGSVPEYSDKIYDLRYDGKMVVTAGNGYMLTTYRYHRVVATDCITKVTRHPIVLDKASIFVKEQSDYCPYQSDYTEDELWAIVYKMSSSIEYKNIH